VTQLKDSRTRAESRLNALAGFSGRSASLRLEFSLPRHTSAVVAADNSDRRLSALLVEDDPAIAELVRMGLRYEGFDVYACADGSEAVRLADRHRPDVVVLDWMLPSLDGLEVCRRLRAMGDPAVLMITAKDAVADRIRGLEAGADDYLIKPFDFDELAARVRAVLRRRRDHLGRTLRFADLELNPDSREVRRGGRSIDLTPREFDLLRVLLEQPRWVLPKRTLLERVWGYDYAGDDNIVEAYIKHLREKLDDRGPSPRLIHTVRGVGYMLRSE
jgi:DNA-binding response OmpR family regulator